MLDFGPHRELPTVLLIDDDLISREVMATVLTMSGYTLHTAEDGDASLALLAAGSCVPDVILMDAQMPGLSGAALITQLRPRSQAAIFAISASQPPAEVSAAADGFLLKPFGPEALRKLLEERQAQAAPTAASVLDPDEPVVDAKTLAQLRELMPEAKVREIYDAVAADLAKRLPALEAALAKRDTAEFRRLGHAVKGGCAMAGAQQAARLGALIETVQLEARGDQLDNAARLLQDLRAAKTSLERILKTGFPA
jgi:CheY-like chemotaxis protein